MLYPCLSCDDFFSHVWQPDEKRAIYYPKIANLVAGTQTLGGETERKFKTAIFERDEATEVDWAMWKQTRGFIQQKQLSKEMQQRVAQGINYRLLASEWFVVFF